jgi:hypothetical protein
VHISPSRLLQFLLPQSGSRSGEVNDSAIFRVCHQLSQFIIRQGPAHPHLFAAPIGSGGVLERVGLDSVSALILLPFSIQFSNIISLHNFLAFICCVRDSSTSAQKIICCKVTYETQTDIHRVYVD